MWVLDLCFVLPRKTQVTMACLLISVANLWTNGKLQEIRKIFYIFHLLVTGMHI